MSINKQIYGVLGIWVLGLVVGSIHVSTWFLVGVPVIITLGWVIRGKNVEPVKEVYEPVQKSIPISCKSGTHFYAIVDAKRRCMYCNELEPLYSTVKDYEVSV